MSNQSWNLFQKQCGGMGLSRSEMSILYRQNMRGGGAKLTQIKNIASSIAKHGDDLIALGKSFKEFHANLHDTDPVTGKKTFKGVSAIDLDKLGELSKKTQSVVGKVADTHDQLTKQSQISA